MTITIPEDRAPILIEALTYQCAQLKFDLSQREYEQMKIRDLNSKIAELEEANIALSAERGRLLAHKEWCEEHHRRELEKENGTLKCNIAELEEALKTVNKGNEILVDRNEFLKNFLPDDCSIQCKMNGECVKCPNYTGEKK